MRIILRLVKNKIRSKITIKKFPVLETERLKLVELTNAHIKDINDLFTNTEVTKFYAIIPFNKENEAKKLIKLYRDRFKENSGIRWGIALKGEKNIIGTIGFNHFSKNHRAVIGYDLKPDYWGKGYMTEALHKILSYGFNELEVNRIEAQVMLGNKKSKKLLYRLNFKKEGVLKEWMLFNNKHYDMSLFAILKSEYNAQVSLSD